MFFCFFIISITIYIILIFSKIQININNLEIISEQQNDKIVKTDFNICIIWLILKKIPILKIKITKEKIDKLNLRERIKKLDLKKIKISKLEKEKIRRIKKYAPQIECINFDLNIGTEDAKLTSNIIAFISIFLGIILKDKLEKSKDNIFVVKPIYQNKNFLKLKLSCIFTIKMIHIIHIIYIIKRRDDKNVRTSNRRAYDYSYE